MLPSYNKHGRGSHSSMGGWNRYYLVVILCLGLYICYSHFNHQTDKKLMRDENSVLADSLAAERVKLENLLKDKEKMQNEIQEKETSAKKCQEEASELNSQISNLQAESTSKDDKINQLQSQLNNELNSRAVYKSSMAKNNETLNTYKMQIDSCQTSLDKCLTSEDELQTRLSELMGKCRFTQNEQQAPAAAEQKPDAGQVKEQPDGDHVLNFQVGGQQENLAEKNSDPIFAPEPLNNYNDAGENLAEGNPAEEHAPQLEPAREQAYGNDSKVASGVPVKADGAVQTEEDGGQADEDDHEGGNEEEGARGDAEQEEGEAPNEDHEYIVNKVNSFLAEGVESQNQIQPQQQEENSEQNAEGAEAR